MLKEKRKADEAFKSEYEYVYGIVTTDTMVRKKNKRQAQPALSATSASANETQSRSLTVTETERELIRQGLVVDEVHEVLEYDRKSMPWVDNFRSSLRIKAEKHITRDASSQDALISKAEYYRYNVDTPITNFITQMGQGKKGWLSRGSVATLHQVTTTERVVDLLNDAENKGSETRGELTSIVLL